MALDPKAVGERIREIRVALGRQKGKKELSLKEFGDLLAVSDVSVMNYERGQIPKAEVLAKILELDQKKRTFDWLLLGTESKKLAISHGHINEGEAALRLNQLRKAADILSRCRDMHKQLEGLVRDEGEKLEVIEELLSNFPEVKEKHQGEEAQPPRTWQKSDAEAIEMARFAVNEMQEALEHARPRQRKQLPREGAGRNRAAG